MPSDRSRRLLGRRLIQSAAERFHASARLDPARVSRNADEIAREVIANLASALHPEVEVTLEIQARFPDGVPEHVRRTVLENCRTLKIEGADFGPE